MFALGRRDVWPAEDLAIQEALRRLHQLEERPDRKTSEELVENWRPHRTVGALFLWHYFAGAPA
jgi:DNA-3-methyladenine glycosylase II